MGSSDVLAPMLRNKGASQWDNEISQLGVFRANNHGKNFISGNVCERSM
jgi:hypothetical protein